MSTLAPITQVIIPGPINHRGDAQYWDFLAASQPEKLESLYREMNPLFATKMTSTDFWDVHGNYYPLNNWNATTNSGSIAHLVQRNNTLSAEIDIAGQATVIREKNGKIVTDRTVLINCSGYGQPNRNSDPAVCRLLDPVLHVM